MFYLVFDLITSTIVFVGRFSLETPYPRGFPTGEPNPTFAAVELVLLILVRLIRAVPVAIYYYKRRALFLPKADKR